MRKSKFLVIALIVAAFCAAQINVSPIEIALLADESRSYNLADYEEHDPVLILSDGDFETQGWPGNGTAEEPYEISGLAIGAPSSTPCIRIENVRACFVINGCLLEKENDLADNVDGLFLKNASNGIIEDNQITIDRYPVYLYNSPNNLLRNSTCFNRIRIIDSNHTTLIGNRIGNETYGGNVDIETSNHANITGNFIYCKFSDAAIYVFVSNNTCIQNNILLATFNRPIKLETVNIITIRNNTCEAPYGIYGHWVSLANVENNSIDSVGYSIEQDYCTDTTFMWNAFIRSETGKSVHDNSAERNFYDYNYYSDYNFGNGDGNGDGIGDEPHYVYFDGVSAQYDFHPLMYPLGSDPLLNSPDDIEYEEGTTGHNITWSPSILSPNSYRIYRNDSLVVDSGVWSGSIIVSVDGLNPGAYNYTLVIFDTSGNSASDAVFVTVVEPTNPIIDSPADIQYESGTTGNNIIWGTSDLDPDSYEVYRNGSQIESGSWDGSDIEISIDGLDLGTHNFTLVVFDAGGHNVRDTVMVVVVDTADPSLTMPEDIQLKVGDTGENITWILHDANPFAYEVFMNVTAIASGTWNSTAETVTIALDGIPVGVHFFTIYVTDLAGNEASDMVIVTVLPDGTTTGTTTTDTTTTTGTTDTTTTSPPADSQFQIMDVLGLGIGFGVFLSVIVFVVLRKRE